MLINLHLYYYADSAFRAFLFLTTRFIPPILSVHAEAGAGSLYHVRYLEERGVYSRFRLLNALGLLSSPPRGENTGCATGQDFKTVIDKD